MFPLFTKYVSSSTAPLPPPKKSVNPLRLFTHPSIVLVLVFNGMVFAVFYGVTTTMSSLFAEAYPFLTESEIGFCFLSIGAGCAIGSFTNGWVLDADYKKIQKMLERTAEAEAGEKGQPVKNVDDARETEAGYPIEYARLRRTPFYFTLFVLATIGYGWSIQRAAHLACPLALQFVSECFRRQARPFLAESSRAVGWTNLSMMNTSQTLLMDLVPSRGGSVTAMVNATNVFGSALLTMSQNNLVRCTMGATLVAIVDFILRAVRPGWTFVVLCGLCVLMWPMHWAVIRFGPRWRARRKLREAEREARRR